MSHQIGVFKKHQFDAQPHPGEWLVLSLTQPWATALFVPGLKRIETRGWRTQYRGTLYIHTSKSFPKYAREFTEEEHMRGRMWMPLELGKIIGSVDLIDIQRAEEVRSKISDVEKLYGDYSDRRYAWITENPRLLPEPIEAKGMLGLWTYRSKEIALHV